MTARQTEAKLFKGEKVNTPAFLKLGMNPRRSASAEGKEIRDGSKPASRGQFGRANILALGRRFAVAEKHGGMNPA